MPIKFYKSVLFRLLVGIFAVIIPINILMIICAQLFYDAMKQQSYRESEHGQTWRISSSSGSNG